MGALITRHGHAPGRGLPNANPCPRRCNPNPYGLVPAGARGGPLPLTSEASALLFVFGSFWYFLLRSTLTVTDVLEDARVDIRTPTDQHPSSLPD